MKAVVITAPGLPDVFQVQSVPDPTLEYDTDLLVRLKAAGVNPIDTKLRKRGTFYSKDAPAILGCDGAGVVEAVGSAVTQFQVGDEVYFCNGGIGLHPGNYAEFATVNEQFAAHKPRRLSFVEAAAAPLVLITAWEALYDRANLEAGRTVLVQAGAGGVGHVAIQLARLAGAKVCTTVSSPEKAKVATDLGADHCIFYQQENVVDAVMRWTEGRGVNLGFDTVGGAVLSQTFAATAIYGDVVTLLAPATDTDWKIARDRNLRFSFELMLTPMLQHLPDAQRDQANILRQCARLIDQGELQIILSKTFPLDAVVEAHRCLEAGGMIGKIALHIAD
ncbi:MAG: zinc-dependent alcohol dehydrogenase family protein [Leptolyngbyaceae bacterium]|nr:zinc-dependent alcohol dehydrogenase family protein [Leptolyngbyaceae bacterium]